MSTCHHRLFSEPLSLGLSLTADRCVDARHILVDAAAPALTAALRMGLAQLRHTAAEDSNPARTILTGMFAALDLRDIWACRCSRRQYCLRVLHTALHGLALCNVYSGTR